MKKYFFIFFLLIFIYIFSSNTLAIYQKSLANPIMDGGPNGEWDNQERLLGHVINDEGIFKMWFTGFDNVTDRIGYATSTDGINWDFHPLNPILSPNPATELHYSDPFVIHTNNEYMMWLTVYDNNGIYKIKYSTSDDGIEWSNPIPINITQTWEDSPWMVQPSVIYQNGLYQLWYSGILGDWKIGYATSTDGINWTKHSNPVLIASEPWEGNTLGGGKVISNEENLEMYYHAGDPPSIGKATSSDGINWSKSSQNPIIVKGDYGFDSSKILSPSSLYISNGSKNYIYYTGYDGLKHGIGLAIEDIEGNSDIQTPIIILPGLFGSWNSDAIIHGENPPQSEWVMTPFVNDYQGLIDTLKSAGYSDNENDPKQNLFVFNYDWRDQVNETSEELNNYIENIVLAKNPNSTITLVGHSLGGLIARTYAQNHGVANLNQVITVGSPHSGTIQAYKAWEGGLIENENFWERLALDIIINLNRNDSYTNKDIVREFVPVTHDLLPTFNYLVDSNNQTISTSTLTHQNSWLNGLETGFSNIYDNFYAIYGNKNQTPEFYKVSSPNIVENHLGLWQDGKPTETINSNLGDETVLAKSATRSADPASLLSNTNHRELITTEESITEILSKANVEVNSIITPTPIFNIFPSLFIAMQSPAFFSVSGPSGDFASEDGYVFIPNIISGNYNINVNGSGIGLYKLNWGITTKTDSYWNSFISDITPETEDNFTINVNTTNLNQSNIVDTDGSLYLENAFNTIERLKNEYPHWSLTLSQHSIKISQNQLKKKDYKRSANAIPSSLKNLLSFRTKFSTAYPKNLSYETMINLTNAYEILKNLSKEKASIVKIKGELLGLEGLKVSSETKLKIKGNEIKADNYQKAVNLLTEANNDFQNKRYFAAEIKIYLIKELFNEI